MPFNGRAHDCSIPQLGMTTVVVSSTDKSIKRPRPQARRRTFHATGIRNQEIQCQSTATGDLQQGGLAANSPHLSPTCAVTLCRPCAVPAGIDRRPGSRGFRAAGLSSAVHTSYAPSDGRSTHKYVRTYVALLCSRGSSTKRPRLLHLYYVEEIQSFLSSAQLSSTEYIRTTVLYVCT